MAGSDDTTAVAPLVRRGWLAYAIRAKWPLVFGAAWVVLAAVDIALLCLSARGLHSIALDSGAAAASRPRATASASAGPSAGASPAAPSYLFTPVAAAAFGPAGTADGDSPGKAGAAIDGNSATAWTTSWYRTARFGNLKLGTGLLLDLGRTARVSGVRILMGPERGADLQVMSGDQASMTALRPQAAATDAGGTVQLAFGRPGRARYVLIWFTLLPPDRTGTYQVSVYDAEVQGLR